MHPILFKALISLLMFLFCLHYYYKYTMQTIIGFGGAFTEAAALNYANLTTELQDTLMEMYFGPSGIGYR